MPIQAPQWTEFLSCPVCYSVFNEQLYRPISLACGHTICRTCLSKLQQRKCPFDNSPICRDLGDLPANFALLQLVSATAAPDNKLNCVPEQYKKYYDAAKKCVEDLALLLKPVSSSSSGSIISGSSSSSSSDSGSSNCVLSRPMQRKLITLVNCQLVEEEGRSRALRAARSLGERSITELILQHQNPQQLSSNLWAAVRGRGCQFLGPGMQEEVLKLILLALEDGSALSRKVLVLFVVQRLEAQYPQASKTAIGHVVQLLYRASCFKVTKRDEESSLMQLKEEYRSYDSLRREHDSQIVQIAMEAGLRIAPDQWSSLLYGDSTHKSHMQSIIDKLQTPQTFAASVTELLIALQRTADPHNLARLRPEMEFLSNIDPSPDVPCPTWENLDGVMKAVQTVVEGLVTFLQTAGMRKHDFLTPFNARYKTSMCRDFLERRNCPRGASCTFAHSEEELEKYRQKSKRAARTYSGTYGEDTRCSIDIMGQADLERSHHVSRGGYQHTGMPLQIPQQILVPPGDSVPSIAPPTGLPHPPSMEVSLPPGTVVQPHGSLDPIRKNSMVAINTQNPQTGYIAPIEDPVKADVAADAMATHQIRFGPPNGDTAILQTGSVVSQGRESMPSSAPTIPQAYVQPMMSQNPAPVVATQVQGVMQGMVAGQHVAGIMNAPEVGVNVPGVAGMMNGQGMGMLQPVQQGMMGPGHPPTMQGTMQQGMMGPGQPPTMQGTMQQGMMGPGQPPTMQGTMQQGMMGPGQPPTMQGIMQNMPAMMPPYGFPYGPGAGMMGPRFPMYPMMYGQYPYPYMPYPYHQGYMGQDVGRMTFDPHYYPPLNPFVDSWKPPTSAGCPPGPGMWPPYLGQQGHEVTSGCEVCTLQKEKEERKRQETEEQSRLCDKHAHSHQHKVYKVDTTVRNSTETTATVKSNSNNNKRGNDSGKSEVINKQNSYKNNNNDETSEESNNVSVAQGKGKREVSTSTKGAVQQVGNPPPEWSTNDDEDHDEFTTDNEFDYERSSREFEQERAKSREDHRWEKDSKHPARQVAGSRDLKTKGSKSQNLLAYRSQPLPKLPESNAKLYRQSLHSLHEKRNSLIQQLQQNDKEATAQKQKLEELSMPNLFRFSAATYVSEAEAVKMTLSHPCPIDTGPVKLKAINRTNGEIFERLGAISGVHSGQVNDSILASWTTSALSDKNDKKSSAQTNQRNKNQWSNCERAHNEFPYWQDLTADLDLTHDLDSPTSTAAHIPQPTSTYTSQTSTCSPMHSQPTVYHNTIVSSLGQTSSTVTSCQAVRSSEGGVGGYSTMAGASTYGKMSSSSPSYFTSSNLNGSSSASAVNLLKNKTNVVYNSMSSEPEAYSSAKPRYSQAFSESEQSTNAATVWPGTSFSQTEPSVRQTGTSENYYDFPQQSEEDHIPFVEGSPIISKYGPISRNSRGLGPMDISRAVDVMADPSVKMTPATAVSPMSGGPLPTSQLAPSRYTGHQPHLHPAAMTMSHHPSSMTTPLWEKSYSLWTTQVNLLEQKALKASTEDEKLSVRLQAIQLQITLKEQELEQAQALESEGNTSWSN
ncbi:uncharacterized protein LOC127852601 [Dreissena polymorpha]|uniref:RING-type E3 ubiquitin transferase n=1 Tax=Dreissena polymorpha TaxID=45954 RepID=A0A9D4S3S3_DREPO|nr:uncharacterized protein LOC127852601 [Dreissena polymorpha]KAH3890671.1 hypothetical protein DPMN_014756 [Dreissena polymorpha]